MRLFRLLPVRNPDKMVKKVVVSSNASCMKEWLVSCFPKGPPLQVVALGSPEIASWSGPDVMMTPSFMDALKRNGVG